MNNTQLGLVIPAAVYREAYQTRGAPAASEKNTCDRCQHYTPHQPMYVGYLGYNGRCARVSSHPADRCPIDGIRGGGYDGYGDYIDVGPKFGCIHWEPRL